MAKNEPMPHYERLLAAANAKRADPRTFLGHVITTIDTREGRRCRSIVAVFTSGAPIEGKLVKFIQQCLFGRTGPEQPPRIK